LPLAFLASFKVAFSDEKHLFQFNKKRN